MDSAQFFYISAGIGIWIIVILLGFFVFLAARLIITIQNYVNKIDMEVENIKTGVKYGFMSLITKALGSKKRR